MRGLLWASSTLAIGLLAACGPGDGSSLDDDGRSIARPYAPPLGSRYGAASFPPTFEGIQQGFFEPFCTECHAGAAAPKGLDLSGPDAYDRLVGVRSVQRPSLSLVEPGEPDESYLVMKLTGGAEMAGRQMPRNRPARPEEEIDTIALWIEAGAPRD